MFSSFFRFAKSYSQLLLSLFLIALIPLPLSVGTVVTELENNSSLPVPAFVRASDNPSLSLSAESAVLIEEESGEVIFEKNSGKRLPMASTTKIMTALVVIENCVLEEKIKIPASACGVEGSSVYLREGEIFSVEELLYALMLASANDAATALAIHTSGSIEEFASLMNKKAEEIGLLNTHFTNPHGLHDGEHYTTAYDLALIAREACKSSLFKQICSTKKTVINRTSSESARLLVNHNRMLSLFEGCFGIKTGFTKTSGRCLVSGAERDGISLIAITLNAPSDWEDHKSLLSYGFSLYERITLIKEGEFSLSVSLLGGMQKSIICKNTKEVSVILPRGESNQITKRIELPNLLFAPISKGEAVGRIIFECRGKIIAVCQIESAFFADASKN